MGNRAIIKGENMTSAVYLHWNGGRDSVEAFLEYCKIRGFDKFNSDYGFARFLQVVSNFMGGDGLSVGIVSSYTTSAGDNGIYWVDGFDIVKREDFSGFEQREYNLMEMLQVIDEKQPAEQQIGKDYFNAIEVPTNELKIGDKVVLKDFMGKFETLEVVGIGVEGWCNGVETLNKPYVNKFCNDGVYDKNCNNYIRDNTARVLKA